jgi:hypothetical protein
MSDTKTNAFKKDDQEAEEESFFGYISNKFHEKVSFMKFIEILLIYIFALFAELFITYNMRYKS